jgi:hypothetical protein
VSDSYAGKPTRGQPYDFFHINSIQEVSDGDLLVSARNTWTVYLINRATGRMTWQLGGRHSSFKVGPKAQFAWQHDAQLGPGNQLTLFDNEGTPPVRHESRAVTLQLDTRAMRARLLQAYTHAPPVLASSQGDAQTLPDRDVFVGWGAQPDFSEYSPDGKQIFSASFPGPVVSYRAFRYAWNAQPASPPVAGVRLGKGNRLTVYASWNGATSVAGWRLMGGSSSSALTPIRAVSSSGFETAIPANTSARYFQVRALDGSGKVLSSSATYAR